jgi:hypothetical protein
MFQYGAIIGTYLEWQMLDITVDTLNRARIDSSAAGYEWKAAKR